MNKNFLSPTLDDMNTFPDADFWEMGKDFTQFDVIDSSEKGQSSMKKSITSGNDIERSKKKKRKLSLPKICVLCIVSFCCLQFGQQFIRFQEIQAEINRYQIIKEQKLAEQEELEKTKLLLDDPAYIERVAREHLGFVYEGEVLVLPSETVTDDIPEYEWEIREGDIH